MLFWLLAGLTLYLISIYVAPVMVGMKIGVPPLAGSRDTLPDPGRSVLRARRAHANLQENMPFFLTLGLAALVEPGVDLPVAVLGAKIFVVTRAVYIPAYLSGVPYLRSAVYFVGLIGCALMGYALI